MGNRFGVQGLGTEPIRSIRDVDNARTSEKYRPTEDPVTAHRIPVDLEERYDGVQRRHLETSIHNGSTYEKVVRFSDGAEKDHISSEFLSQNRRSILFTVAPKHGAKKQRKYRLPIASKTDQQKRRRSQ